MKRWLLLLMLPWLLAGCVLERFQLPESYRPVHAGATAPLADGAAFKGIADPQKGGEVILRFIRTGASQYVVEHYLVMPEGEDIVLPPAYARFLPLGGAHYALFWKRIGEDSKQGYALVRIDAERFQVLEPMSQSSTQALAQAHGITARPPGLVGGYTLDTTDEARVLKFFKDLAVRKTEIGLMLAATKRIPADLQTRTYAKLGEHIPRLKRKDIGTIAEEEALVAYARKLGADGIGAGHYLLARLAGNGWGMPVDGPLAIRQAEEAVTRGVARAGSVAAYIHYHGVGVPADPDRAVPIARRAADAGAPSAMLLLGLAHRDGQGVGKDLAEARRWFRQAADAGSEPAHALWASLLLDDKTAESDRAAAQALEIGIGLEDPHAYYLRGFLHEHGRGGLQDLALATRMFLMAAGRGDAYSGFLAGERLVLGQGVAQDLARGRAMLAKAEKAGIVEARSALERPAYAKPYCAGGECGKAMTTTERNRNLDNAPWVFAGLRYGSPHQEAIKLFGKPERIDDSTASTKLFWANGQFAVGYRTDNGLIDGFNIAGPGGVQFVAARAPGEPLLRLMPLSQEEIIRVLGKPSQIWYDDKHMDWDYRIDNRTEGSIFFKCVEGMNAACAQLHVHWSGPAVFDPNDGVDAHGLRVSPFCSATYDVTLKTLKQDPTGGKATNSRWELEIYANAKSGSWTVLGRSSDKTYPAYVECVLAKGTGDYRAEVWYKHHFAQQAGKR
ncbi:MAG: sel1 repeat family protein [Burkholderiaceae bacterium]|nr:sel1 repeat family protein [Burkholderiaceae bacterium]